MKVSVLGAGSWGTALSIHLARAGHEVTLWGRDAAVAEGIRSDRTHPTRLAGIAIPETVRISTDLSEAFLDAETLVLAVPCASLRALLHSCPRAEGKSLRFISTGKGIEPESLARMSEVIREYHPRSSVLALSGPTFAEGVARGDPSAAVIAGEDARLARQVQNEFSTSQLRLYSSDDIVGVELCGALKNVVAIAAGIVSGLGFGHNTLAALVTRGLTEMGRIVLGWGGQERTIHGLAGIGDLMLTCTGQESRNRRLGEEVGRGGKLADVLLSTPEVAEGARTSVAVPTMAARVKVEAPIAEAVVQVLYEGVEPRTAVERLMTRALREE
jgi:glycerol-3-phosphate dehydrogenase (NAD(P)+)